MPYASLFSVLFFAACIVALVTGIFVLLNNHRSTANRCFFALIVAISLWSVGMALAISATDAAVCENWRRVSALGWSTVYSILLHFLFIITNKKALLKKWWFYSLLYLPAGITVLAFVIPSGINPTPYQLYLTEFGWVNVAANNIWDWIFYVYYGSYSIIAVILVFLWGKGASDKRIKIQSRIIFVSFLVTLVLASITDIILNSMDARLPQMAPIIMLIPITAIYHTIKRQGFIVSTQISKKGNYATIISCVVLYIVLYAGLIELEKESKLLSFLNLESGALRGILTQLQMLIAVFLAIKEDKPGYIAAFLLNIFSVLFSVVYMIRNASTAPLPGILANLGVFLVLALIISYKKKTAFHIEKIEQQTNILRESEKKLQHMAFYDALTELPNKGLFINRLDQAIHAAKRNAYLIGVIYIDLDSFKSVNDTMGHTIGDSVLQHISDQLSSCFRKEDTVSRFGGDEFLIQVGNIEKTEDINIITDKIMNVFSKAFIVRDIEFFVTASIGVAVYPVDGEDSETLIKNADIAMYAAKSNGKNQCVYCSPELKNDIIRNLKLTNSLYRALDKNELFVYYQPQVKTETQEIIGFEALLRWKHKEYGMVSPNVFIPIAEKTGLIKQIGLWVIETACEQLKKFRNTYHKDLRVSVNVSIEQLKDVNITEQIRKILEDTETDAGNIQIEITESAAFNRDPYILDRLKDLKNLGVTISIDDFGTGHSSLSRLKIFPIDLIKIDMEFVRGISSESEKDKAIIKSIIQIAKNLDMQVLAEGVETEEQFRYLKNKKCDEIQGYYFYKPMPTDEIETIMAEAFS